MPALSSRLILPGLNFSGRIFIAFVLQSAKESSVHLSSAGIWSKIRARWEQGLGAGRRLEQGPPVTRTEWVWEAEVDMTDSWVYYSPLVQGCVLSNWLGPRLSPALLGYRSRGRSYCWSCSWSRGLKVKVKSLSRVQLFVTPWTIAYQAPPSMGFSRQEYWSGLPFPSPGDLPNPGIEPGSPAFQADTLTSEPPGKPKMENQGRGHLDLFPLGWLKSKRDSNQS